MRRLTPRSLIGQMALLIGAALLVAQLVNFALILNERQKLSLAQNQGPAITRFASVATDFLQAPPEFKDEVLEDSSRRGARFRTDAASSVPAIGVRETAVEARLRQSLADAGVTASDVRAAFRARAPRGGDFPRREARGPVRILLLSAQLPDGSWLNGRMATPGAEPWLTFRLGAATLLLYIIVLGATLIIAVRLVRPLRDLTSAAEQFAGRDEPVTVEPRGPSDLRRAIEAFNAMNRRVLALLDEKDRMLGALGHDLRTPLASIRIRIEDMEPESERLRIIAITEEMTQMLEDILFFARSGRARDPEEETDAAALAQTLVCEYREVGASVATGPLHSEAVGMRPMLVRRAVRNLVDNALKYAGTATLSVYPEEQHLVIEVADSGPGLDPALLQQVAEPFYRVEESRNRESGGAGLGLAIAKAVAEAHGGTLRLENGPGGGLVASLRLARRVDTN